MHQIWLLLSSYVNLCFGESSRSHQAILKEPLDLQARVASVGQVLYGTYVIPDSADLPIDIIINPMGDKTRSQKRSDHHSALLSPLNMPNINCCAAKFPSGIWSAPLSFIMKAYLTGRMDRNIESFKIYADPAKSITYFLFWHLDINLSMSWMTENKLESILALLSVSRHMILAELSSMLAGYGMLAIAWERWSHWHQK